MPVLAAVPIRFAKSRLAPFLANLHMLESTYP
jgi:hypothetical protein